MKRFPLLEQACNYCLVTNTIHIHSYNYISLSHIYSLSVDACECHSDVAENITDDQVLFSRSQNFFSFTSPSQTMEREIFEYYLRNVNFIHDNTRPPTNQYSAYVRVHASDGTFTSDDSFTNVIITVDNQPPTLTISGQDSQENTLFDGMDIFALAPQGNMSATEDSGVIGSVSIELTNPQHPDERLFLSSIALPGSISGSVSADGRTITLTGPATASLFAEVLSYTGLLEYSYPAYASILQGDTPDFTQR